MWAGLAPLYDRIFPPGKAQVEFILAVASRMDHPARRLLDVGCATGGYAFALAEAGFDVTGVDLSPAMIRLASLRTRRWEETHLRDGPRKIGQAPRFLIADMTGLRDLPFDEKASFEAVICLGNTVASLLSAAELGAGLGEMARVLGPGGRAVIQTVNYDRLAATGEVSFPPITISLTAEELAAETPEFERPRGAGRRVASPSVVPALVFRRVYLPRPDGLIDFVTTLERIEGEAPAEPAPAVPPPNVVFRETSILRPTLRDELEAVARMAFHGNVEVYGDFRFTPWSVASPATVVVTSREE